MEEYLTVSERASTSTELKSSGAKNRFIKTEGYIKLHKSFKFRWKTKQMSIVKN